MEITDMLGGLITLFFLPYLSIGAVVRSDDVSTVTITITTDTLNPIGGTVSTTYTTTILSPIFIGPTETQSSPVSSTTFGRLPSSRTTSSDSSISTIADSTTTSSVTSFIAGSTTLSSPTSSATSIPPILAGGDPGDSTRTITNAGIIGLSTGLGVAFTLAGIAFWINRRQKKAQAKIALMTTRLTRDGGSHTTELESMAQRRWHEQHGSSDGYWIGGKETEAQVTPIAGRRPHFQHRLNSLRKGPYAATNVSDEGYWTSSQRLRSYSRPRASRSTPRIGRETPSLSESENLREQTDLAMRDVESELDKLNRSMTVRANRAQDDPAIPQRRISPEDLAIQKFNDLHAAYQLYPLTGRERRLPDLPNEDYDTAPQAISSHDVRSNMVPTTEAEPVIDFRTARHRTQALEVLEGRRYASSSDYSQDSSSETPESVEGVKCSKTLPNLRREKYG